MRTRVLRPSFVFTASAALAAACHTTPPRTRKPGPVLAPIQAGPRPDYEHTKYLNPSDEKGHEIRVGQDGTTCFVILPFDDPPNSWQPPPTKQIDCPPAMDDPAWDACRGGSMVKNTETSSCMCVVEGNPPPSPWGVACPK
jgi:hypothetical protein